MSAKTFWTEILHVKSPETVFVESEKTAVWSKMLKKPMVKDNNRSSFHLTLVDLLLNLPIRPKSTSVMMKTSKVDLMHCLYIDVVLPLQMQHKEDEALPFLIQFYDEVTAKVKNEAVSKTTYDYGVRLNQTVLQWIKTYDTLKNLNLQLAFIASSLTDPQKLLTDNAKALLTSTLTMIQKNVSMDVYISSILNSDHAAFFNGEKTVPEKTAKIKVFFNVVDGLLMQEAKPPMTSAQVITEKLKLLGEEPSPKRLKVVVAEEAEVVKEIAVVKEVDNSLLMDLKKQVEELNSLVKELQAEIRDESYLRYKEFVKRMDEVRRLNDERVTVLPQAAPQTAKNILDSMNVMSSQGLGCKITVHSEEDKASLTNKIKRKLPRE